MKKDTADSHYDIVVIGSDEVFNCAQKTWFGFSPQLYGEGLNADKVISYAASFGATTIEKLQLLGVKDDVARMLVKNFILIRFTIENLQMECYQASRCIGDLDMQIS